MMTSRQAATTLGVSMDALRYYHRNYGYGTKLGDRLTWSDADLQLIREHIERGPGYPAGRPRKHSES